MWAQWRNYQNPIQLKEVSVDSTQEYIKGLPLVRRRLLSWYLPMFGMPEMVEMLKRLGPGGLAGGSDGSLKRYGTFGYAIADAATSQLLWKGAGPVDGDPTTLSSKRSEWYGVAALLEALHLWATGSSSEGWNRYKGNALCR